MSPQADETLAAPVDATLSWSPLPSRPPVAGDRIGRYVVLERLGAGGMGIVFAAYDPELDRRVAVKLMRHDRGPGSDGSGGREHLMSEARALAKLAHPNVIGVHDVGLHEGGVFVAMEYIDGRTLTAWAAEQIRTADEVLRVYRDAGAGLSAAHLEGVVHRDFKPDNVMIDRRGRVRVLDFGLARAPLGSMADSDIAALSIHDPATMGFAGTPAYMAPEQLAGDSIDARADQFSFCVALYESLFGERPFQGDTVAALAWATLEEQPAMPSGSGVPATTLDALSRGLAKSPDERFASMRELIAALEPPRPSPYKTRVLVGAVTVGIGALAWALATPGADPPDPCASADALWSSTLAERFAEAATGAGAANVTNTAESLRKAAETIDGHRRATCRDRAANRLTDEEQDRRMLCLDRRARTWTVAVDYLLEHPDVARVRGMDVVPALASADRCLDPRASELPEDAEGSPRSPRIARLHTLESNLDAAHVLMTAGERDRSRSLVEQVIREASEESLPWAESRARFLRANYASTLEANPDLDIAAEYRRAFTIALRANRQSVQSHASVVLADHYGEGKADADMARMWLDIAQAVAERGGLDDAERSHLARVRGSVAVAEGDLQAALQAATEALAYCRKRGLDDTPACAREQADRAERLINLGRFDEATRALSELVDAFSEAGEADIPLALDIRRRYVFALVGAGELEAAATEGRKTLADAEAVFGRGSPQTIPTMSEVSVALSVAGDHEAALQLADRVVEATDRDDAGNPFIISYALHRRGTIRGQAGRWEEGVADLERALAIRSGILEPTHPSLRAVHYHLADALLVLGRAESARPHLQATDCARQGCGAELAGAPLVQAEALAMLGEPDDARRVLDGVRATLPEAYAPWATWCDLLLADDEPSPTAVQSLAADVAASPELVNLAPGFVARLAAQRRTP